MFNTWFIQRHKVNKLVFWRWFNIGKNSVNKPCLQVLIDRGKPSVCLGLASNRKEALLVVPDLSSNSYNFIWCCVGHSMGSKISYS